LAFPRFSVLHTVFFGDKSKASTVHRHPLWFALHRSIYGRYLLAVGRNEQAARFSGINTQLVIASACIVAGTLTGVSGILIAFNPSSVGPSNHGNFNKLYGIAAAGLGGCSLRGAKARSLASSSARRCCSCCKIL
jgi:ribose/xylose/arabinose/galactoside ABC-type transport system permease subunit